MLKARKSGIRMTVKPINKLLNSHDLRSGLFRNCKYSEMGKTPRERSTYRTA